MTSKKHSGSGDIGDMKDRAVPLLKPDGRFNTVHLLPVLLNSKESSFSLAKPSIFNNEMQMSAEDRIHKLIHTREKVSVKANKELEHSLSFRFFPKVVVFQNFLPGKVYKVPVSVRNACQIMKPLQITYEESQHFSVSFTSGLFTRIAPGMGTVLMVHFTPEDKKDYSYQISLQSNQECFKVPIFAIGPRPLLDFPDDIHIPSGPIKIRCTKVVLVRNIGDVPAIFSLATSSPFEVEPRKGVLRSSEMMNVRVSVTPKKCGNIQGQLKICYETGEILYSKLYGIGEEANIWMDKSSIQIEETFINVKQVATVTLHNDSNHLLHFKWKKMETVEDEFAEYDKLMNGYSFMRNLESQKYSKLSKGEVVDPETHTQVYNRMYDDEVRALKNEEFLFNHAHIKLRPLTGDIWPKSSIDIMVIFEPKESGKHSTVAYCDIPGHDKRLPLIICGLVKGPQFAFNLDFLDIDCVFVSKPHCYEVVVKNVGLIPGTIAFQPTRTKYGGKISCSPESLGLMPEESKTFLLTFSSNVQGEFLENILFKVIESDNILKIELKGSVVTPTLKFSVDKIDFGIVPFSFPVSNIILLQNLSMVPVNYKLTIKGDGVEPSISYKQYAAAKEKPRFPKNPKEFTVIPNRGTVEAYSSCKIKITLIGNINREKKSTLVLELLDAISEHVCIPISHTVAFPTIKCSPNDINIRFCFISYPYVRTLVLENKSNVMGFFYIPNPPVYAMGTLMFSAPISHGIIKAGSKIKIPITILTNSLGLQTCTVSMITLGDDSPKEICTLSGCGQGPVMTAEPHHLDYGNVDLLDTVTKEFILTNDSPVPASYSMTLMKKNSPWEVVQRSGILPAEKNVAVEVNIFLRDTGRYKDTLQIDVFGSRTLQVTLAAEGVGTSLVITPAFCPIFDLGYVLTNKIIERNFTITNEGNRHHQITWTPLPTFKEKSSKKDEPEPIIRTLFHIEPDTMQLSGRQSTEFLIRGISEKIQQVSEQFFCHAVVAGKKETLLFTKIKANFIDPKVIFSKPEIVFKVEIGPKENYKILYDNVNMTNATDLPYKIELKTESPFLIMGKNEPVSKLSLVLDSLATVELTIIFDTSCITDLYSRKFQNVLQVSYREHTHMDHLPLSGEANFPNINVFPDILDFGCIPSGSGASETFEIVNNGQLPIKYHWYWLPDGNVDYADECRKKESRSLSAISLTNIDEDQDDQTSVSETSLDKPNDEVDLKELKSKKKKRVSKVTDEDIKAMLFPIIAQFFEEETEEQALQSLPTALSDVDRENQYFDIAPWYGELHPFEVQTISAKFSGPEPTIQCGVLACRIEGGPTQVLLVRGEIADLDYSLDKSVVDIGYQIFCMPSMQIIKLTNTGNLPFDFSFDLSRNEVPRNETTSLKVEPNQGYLTPKQFIVIQVDFTPGLIRKINETFTLQVGFLDPVPVTLEGWGVIPQLYAFLPRPKSYVTVIDIGYEAVDLLLEEFLINEKKKKKKKSEKNDELSLFGRSLSRRELNVLARNGWSVVTYEDQYPTLAEIDLTVEKLLAQDHMDSCSYANIKLWTKNQCIPGLIFPPYDIDFGIVLVGTSVSYSALLYNYGPIPVTGSFQFNPRRWMLSEQGFSFKLPTIMKLGADQTVSMQIFFNPTRSMYKEKKNDVEFLIYLEIAYGARIPIQVRAIVTLPYLVASVDAIDFEAIKCGERKAVTITLSNEGLVPCIWRCEIKGRRSEGSFTFGFLETMTTLLPQQSVDLSIIFKPFTPGTKETILTILSDNIEKLEIPLTGTAVEPRVTLSDHVLKFDPTLPYPENYIRTFKVKNSGIHPIEFYLPHLDSQIMEEERILRVLCDYYETDHLCLPVRNIGDDLPKEITSFYNKLVGMLKSVDAEGPNGLNAKKKKRRSKNDKPKFPQLGSASQMTSVSPSQVTVASETPNSSDHIEEALHENMEILRKKLKNNDKNDPVKEANDAVNKTDASLDNESKEGMLLIFHGAPFTDSIFHARRVAKSLNLKLLSIDDAVIESAATSSFPEAIKLREKINTLYSEKVPMRVSKSEIKEEMGEYEEEDEMDDFPIDDPIEEMRSKVKFILYGPKKDMQNTTIARGQSRKTEIPSARVSSVPSQQTRRSIQKKGATIDVTCGTIPGISVEILEEILKKRLTSRDCFQGVVIDQLTSMFFETAGEALTSILRAQGFVKYIHCFYFYNTFETYATLFNEEKLAAEEAQKLEMERKMALFETLTVEEAEELSESDQALYWSMMMAKRKEEWLLKKNESKKGKKNKKKSITKPEKKGGKRNSKSQPSPETQSPSDNAKKKDKGKKGEGKGKQKTLVQPEQDFSIVDELAGVHLLFNTFETEYADLISIAMNWDKRKGMPNTSVSNKQSNTKGKASRRTTPQGSSIAQRLSAMESGNHSVKVSDSVPESIEDESLVIWVFDCANPDPHKDELLISFLGENEEFISSKPETSPSTKLHPTVVNWCVPKPKVRQKIPGPEEFIFCNYEEDDGADEKVVKKIKTNKRKSLKKKAEIDTKPEARKVKTRWILNPGEQAEIKIQFDPRSVGEYMFTYPIEVVGWRKPQHITVQGICDLPRIDMDPEVLFDHIVETKEHDKLYRLTFFLDTQYFDFGSILVTKPKDKRLHHIATSFSITNCSSLTAEVRFSFLDKTYDKVDTFAIEPVLLNIKPFNTDKVTVFAMPRSLGTVTETIVCSIKDNPALEQIKISCTGVKVDFEVEPRSISFDHVLVFRKDFRIIKLKNKSLVPVIWHFIGFDDAFLEQFDISSTEGLIMPLDDQDIRIEFFATQVVNSLKKVIKVEVFDEEGRGEAVHTENILIHAESVDVVVDISFSDPRKNYVDFGKAKVRSENLQEFYLKNRGKHDVIFKIETDIPANVNIPNLQKVLYVRPVHGILAPYEKASTLEVICTPTFEVYLYAVPIFKCYLLDGQNIVATIPIQVSISAQWCRYEISPKPDMNFGVIPIGIKKVLPLTIKNTGVWDITYTINKVGKSVDEDVEKMASDVSPMSNPSKSFGADGSKGADRKSEKEERSSLIKKTKSFRYESSVLRCDQFTILSRSGTVTAGEATTIEVECHVEQEGSFNEMISIDIPDKNMDNPLPDIIEVLAVARAPFIDFTSLDSIFEEHYICETLEDMDCPCDIHNHNIFIKSENKFLFANTCLGTPNVARLKLYNPGLIPCELNSQTRQTPSPTAKALVSSSSKSSEPAFTVKPTKLCIAPYSTEFLEVTFLPPQIGIFNGVLEMNLESSTQKDCKFVLQLAGEGCVPIITIIEPQQYASSESTDLMFFPTLLGKKSTQKLKFKNTGSISCYVRLNVNEMDKSMFGIIGNEKTLPLIINESPEDINSIYMLLTSGLVATFEVTFMPTGIGKFSGPIHISIDGNPYEKIVVNLVGECYTEDITLELPSVVVPGSHDDEDEDKVYQYTLTFGNCFADTPKHISFKIFNHSQKSVFRFQFNEDKYVKFVPNIGHVKPNSTKEITATFLSRKPAQVEKNPLECHLEKISFPEGIPEGTSWDSRLTEVHWADIEAEAEVEAQDGFEVLETEKIDGLKHKVVEPATEPSYDAVADSSFTIPILTSAMVAYTEYSCSIKDYEFPETLMFHSNTCKFTLQNTGTIPLTFNWNVVMDEHYPLRVPSDAQTENIESIDSPPSHEISAPETADTIENNNLPLKTSRTSRSSHTAKKKESEDTSNNGTKDAETSHAGISKDEPLDRESFGDDEFSMTRSLTNRSQETWLSTDPIPFSVDPQFGTLNPEETILCTLTFSPLDIFDFKVIVIAMIPHLHPKTEPLKIVVKGRSLLPLCYFKMEESDYISGGRRDLSLPGPLGVAPGIPLHAETRVVEFKVIGVSGTYHKKLTVINPTDVNYNFYWENLTTPNVDSISMFFCSPMKGRIECDGEVDTICNFIAHDTGTFESFWDFVIPEHDAKYHFLFVSHVSEPSACFLSSHIELCPTVIGLCTSKTTSLISNEDTPLKFYFEQNSLFALGYGTTLEIRPMKGKIIPGEDTAIKIQFTPKFPGKFNFHVKCFIKGLKKPLILDVSAECYHVQPVVTYESNKNNIITLDPAETNVIELGEVSIRCPQNIIFRVTNIGKTTFYYHWHYDEIFMKRNKMKLTFQSRGGHITSQSRTFCTLTCTFLAKSEITDFLVILKINKGPDYKIVFRGYSTRPNYKFSSLECNFGLCFFKEGNPFIYKKSICIKNMDVTSILFECQFENTPYFALENASGPIEPHAEKEFFVSFSPQGLEKYEEVVEFIINGCTKQKFKIVGEGIEIQVALQNPQNKLILFAPVLPGGNGFACAPVVNESKSEVAVEFFCGKCDFESRSTLEGETAPSTPNTRTTQAEIGTTIVISPFEITPSSVVFLKPREVVNLCVRFRPTVRTKLITEKVYMRILDHTEPLCILEGSCVGPDFSFDRYCVTFGAVLKGCTTQQKLKLINSGEVGARFKWEKGEWDGVFRISPMKGYSSPDTETTFTIVFCPNSFDKCIRCMAVCSIDDYPPMRVNLTGACWEEPVAKENISFNVAVRSQEKKTIPIINKSVTPWEISPRLTGQYFYGPDIIHIPPHSTVNYEVTYTPLVMTVGDKNHKGSVVFCIPEGQALAYELTGTADKPLSSGKITGEMYCKESYTELIPISNWLTTSQRFMISNEVGKFDKFDPVVEISGNEYIDVPGKAEREYKWTVFCYKECTLNVKVVFKNTESNEYLFYELVLKVLKRGPLEVIKFCTPVRQSITRKINLENPLGSDVNFSLHCSSSEIQCKTPIIVPAYSKSVPINIKYTPLFTGESTISMDLQSNELGNFPYELELKALPPVPENLLKCSTSVGQSVTMEAPICNLTKNRAEFSCKIEQGDNRDFETDKQVTLASNSKGNVAITFEPTTIGNISATLNITSPTAGEFIFPLLGTASEPMPQGPFSIKMGGSITIAFKNIFNDKQMFTYTVDNPLFTIKASNEGIRPKKDTRIVINFPKNIEIVVPVTGKLIVFSTTPSLSHIKWIYYLKGVDTN